MDTPEAEPGSEKTPLEEPHSPDACEFPAISYLPLSAPQLRAPAPSSSLWTPAHHWSSLEERADIVLCAVPKKRTSLFMRRVRRGQSANSNV